ncbi:tripartite tricarboxylate transporter substrate-binding protein [Comamonadaceae bacterium G21597-S1]|nr:tripartite tricarboxylate transporter substrate-binding protein [Comamonadaceae bacterium G21597-S1]
MNIPMNRSARLTRRKVIRALSAASAMIATASYAREKWPARPIRLIVPVTAGGALDILGRSLAEHMGNDLGQRIVVENHAGADLAIGHTMTAKSPPDGYTMMITSNALTSTAMLKQTPYDPINDFSPVGEVGYGGLIAVAPAALGVKDLAQFVALAKSKPGEFNYATPGIGSGSHINTALLEQAAGIKMTAVVYKGAATTIPDLLANRIQFTMLPLPVAAPLIAAQKLQALAVASPDRSSMFSSVPTMNEFGYPSVTLESWVGILMPAKTPGDIVSRTHAALRSALKNPEVRSLFERTGTRIAENGSPESFARQLKSEMAQWPRLFEIANIKPES